MLVEMSRKFCWSLCLISWYYNSNTNSCDSCTVPFDHSKITIGKTGGKLPIVKWCKSWGYSSPWNFSELFVYINVNVKNSLELFCLKWKQISLLLGKFLPVIFSEGYRMFIHVHVCLFLSVKSICKIMWSASIAVHWRTTSGNKVNKNIWQSILWFSPMFTWVIKLKQLFASGSVNIGEYLPQLHLGKYSPIFTLPLANNC